MRIATHWAASALGVLILAVCAQAGDDEPMGQWHARGGVWDIRERGGFRVDVIVNGRSLPFDRFGDRRVVSAIQGAEYEVRITNPLPVRVAVALSVDGLNTIDARQTGAWDASKWL